MTSGLTDWTQFARLYWRAAGLLTLLGLAVSLGSSSLPIALALGGFGALGLGLYALRPRWLPPRWAVAAHLLLCIAGCGGVAWHFLGAPTPVWVSALVYETFPSLSQLAVLGAAIFGGWWGLLAGLLLHIALVPSEPTAPYISWLLAGCMGLLGVWLEQLLTRLLVSRGELERMAYHDPLTGLLNRRAAQEQYPHHQAIAKRYGLKLWLVAWDLDNLKAVNDSAGHAAGDRLIVEFAQTLQHTLRESDVAFRVGGDEFWSLHFGDHADRAIERVRSRFAGVSAGFVSCDGWGLEQAVAQADQALYQDKSQRRVPSARQAPNPRNKA